MYFNNIHYVFIILICQATDSSSTNQSTNLFLTSAALRETLFLTVGIIDVFNLEICDLCDLHQLQTVKCQRHGLPARA